MTPKAQQDNAFTTVLTARWEQVARKIADLAEALPGDKIDAQPITGLRSYGEVLRHVAFWNHYVADTLKGKKTDESPNELPRKEYATKALAVKALNQSSAEVAAELGKHSGSGGEKTAELVVTFLEHTSEHYGQLVVYARLMGIVPPASRS